MQEKLYQPTCVGCPHNLHYLDFVPKKQCGVMMHCGEHFCTGGKRARRFKKSEPKLRVPDWCPRRKNPCELRVYALKNADEWRLHSLLDEGIGEGFSPSASRYALRFEGTTELSPYEFWKQCELEPAAALLPIQVELYEVLEIDDGLKSVFFYQDRTGLRLQRFFDTEQAQKNVYQEGREDAE